MHKTSCGRIREIIKYNTARQYFGTWTPENLHDAYKKIYTTDRKRTIPMYTGAISENDICDALWTEMSYNPVRFGSVSPFMFDGKNSLKLFYANCDEYKENENKLLFAKLKKELNQFMSLMKKQDPVFAKTGISSETFMNIGLQEYSIRPNESYQILSHLVTCIHEISKQNVKDFDLSAVHFSAIMNVCLQRHPDYKRGIRNPNFSKIDSLNEQQSILMQQISEKRSDIIDAQMKINNLAEYEIPASNLKDKMAVLEKHNKELESLDRRLQTIRDELYVLSR